MKHWMGIDGGGTHLRVIIVDDSDTLHSEYEGDAVNPNTVTPSLAAGRIQSGISAALARAGLHPSQISGVGAGIAGAAAEHSTPWLQAVLEPVLPGVPQRLASDVEIALVAAHGQRMGILVLAGTGSSVFGVNAAGTSRLVGGWGPLLGDVGGGCWIGQEALRWLARQTDHYPGKDPSQALMGEVLALTNAATLRSAVTMLYRCANPAAEMAQLAPRVLALAEAGDFASWEIAMRGADGLASLAQSVMASLAVTAPVGFAGGLLEQSAFYRRLLAQNLIVEPVVSHRTPVWGAAALARIGISSAYSD